MRWVGLFLILVVGCSGDEGASSDTGNAPDISLKFPRWISALTQ